MFQNLLNSAKIRILDEIQLGFQNHPAFSGKVKVYNKFPYTERVQFGAVLKNTSASQIRLSADNFMSDLFSLVKVTRQDYYPGISIEWVREDQGYITQYITGEDVSSQLGVNQRLFHTLNPILAGPDETHYATSPGQVYVTVNGSTVIPEYVDGKKNEVLLETAPGVGSTVLIGYHIRRIVPPGLFTINFIRAPSASPPAPGQFTVDARYIIEKEVIIKRIVGTEHTSNLTHQNIETGTDVLYLTNNKNTVINTLVRGTDYSIDYTNGIITYLKPLLSNYSILGDYRYTPNGFSSGPFNFELYQENHLAIPGVILSIGRRAQAGDQQIIVVSQFREQQARIYGGHWEMSMDLSVIAKDPIQMAEMSDQVVNWLWAVRKNYLEFEGITLNSVEPAGETEESHIETTGDLYYESSVAINVRTEWQYFVPYDYYVTLRGINLYPDLRPTFKGPLVGFERLT